MRDARVQVGIWLLVRLLTVLSLALPNWDRVASDMVLFRGWMDGLASGQAPSGEMWQYPPGVALLLLGPGSAHLGLPGLLACVLAADAAVQWVTRGTPGGLLWAVTPLLIGPLFLLRLDTIVTALAVYGVVAGRRWVRAGILFGLGGAIKLWPLLLGAAYARSDSLRRTALGAAAYAAVASGAMISVGGTGFVANQGSRGLQIESVAAWPFMVAKALGFDIELVFRYGAIEVNEPLADLIAKALLPVSLAAVAAIAAWSWRACPSALPSEISPRALVVVCVLLMTSRVLSPQFNIWLLGFVALTMATASFPRRGIVAAGVSAVAAQILYPHAYTNLYEGGRFGLLTQSVRLGALMIVLATAITVARGQSTTHPARDVVREGGGLR